MASKLRAVKPSEARPSKPKVLIFGKPGAGKTWTSLDFPSVYYIDTEGGANLAHYIAKLEASGGLYLGPEHGSQEFETILQEVQTLATEKHPYKTLVIDSLSKVFNNEIAREAARLGDKDQYGASKKPATNYSRQLARWLVRLDMNVILICHEKSEWGLNAKGERAEVGVTFDAWEKFEYELHLCLNIFKAGPDHKAKVRKTRLLGFPMNEVFPWNYAEFATRYGKDIIEGEVVQVTLATAEQVVEINRLLDIVKMPEDWATKCLARADVDTFAEMDADKLQACIDAIKTKQGVAA